MLDLSERLADCKATGKTLKDKAVVELAKDGYMIVSFKADRTKFAVCLLQTSINSHNMADQYEKHAIGDEIEVRTLGCENGLHLTVPKLS